MNDETAADIIHMGQITADTLTLSGVNVHDNTATGTGAGVSNGIFWSWTTVVTSSTIANNTTAGRPIAADIAAYAGRDLLCYRAEAPEKLRSLQAKHGTRS